MTRRSKSEMDADNARRFMIATVNTQTTQLLRAVEEICRRYPPNDDLIFVRYLLRMIVLETKRSHDADGS